MSNWRIMATSTNDRLCFTDDATGEIREVRGGFNGLIEMYDEYRAICGEVAKALGPAVLRAWEEC